MERLRQIYARCKATGLKAHIISSHHKRFDARGNRPIGDGEPAPSAKVDIAEGEIEGCELRSSVAVAMLSAVAT